MMVENKNMIIENSEVFDVSFEILQNFLHKWKDAFKDIDIDINKTSRGSHKRLLQTTLSGKHLSSDKQIHINVDAIKNSPFHEDVIHEINMYLEPEYVSLFNKEDINPEKLRNEFYLMAKSLGGINCDDIHKLDMEFLFDKKGDIKNITAAFKNNKGTDNKHSAHYIYNCNDVGFLKREGLYTQANIQILRNFHFLWENTSIQEMLRPDNFLASFKMYEDDSERFNSLIRMIKI